MYNFYGGGSEDHIQAWISNHLWFCAVVTFRQFVPHVLQIFYPSLVPRSSVYDILIQLDSFVSTEILNETVPVFSALHTSGALSRLFQERADVLQQKTAFAHLRIILGGIVFLDLQYVYDHREFISSKTQVSTSALSETV